MGEGTVFAPRVFANTPGETPLLDKIWSWPNLIDNPENRFIQKLRIIGRYQWQYGNVSSSQGDYSEDETRRRRVGLHMRFLDQFRIRVQLKGEGEQSLFESDNVEDAWIAWRPKNFQDFKVKLGQFKPVWSYEWALSSNTMPIVERSQFVNQFRPDRSTGIGATLERGKWTFGLTGFSGDLDDGVAEDPGAFGIANIGYDLGDLVKWDELEWRFDYLYNDNSDQISSSQAYSNAFATSLAGKIGRFGCAAELMYIDGLGDAGNAFGATLLPRYSLIDDRLFLVGRLHYSNSNSSDRLAVQSRYESEVPGIGDGKGKSYYSAYAGVTWHLYKKMQFMNGIEYSRMREGGRNGGDFDGWTFFSGFRIWF